MISRRDPPVNNERGAVFAEFAMVSIGLMALMALLVDASLVLSKYALLTDATAGATRKASSDIPAIVTIANGTCEQLACLACFQAREFQQEHPFAAEFTFTAVARGPSPESPYPSIALRSSWLSRCIICTFLSDRSLTANSVLTVESSQTACLAGEATRNCSNTPVDPSGCF